MPDTMADNAAPDQDAEGGTGPERSRRLASGARER